MTLASGKAKTVITIEKNLHVAGVVNESGGIKWNFGRKRGIEI
jgi:hypothetical protein